MRFGVPFSEFDTVFFGIGVERTEIKPGTDIPAAYLALLPSSSATPALAVPLTIGWSRDSRDSALVPTAGAMQRVASNCG